MNQQPSKIPYRPIGMQMWDTWYANRGDETHAIYLQLPTSEAIRPAEAANFLGHAVSTNLIDWIELPNVLGPNVTGSLDDLAPWTGCLYEHDDSYYLYYTMRASRPVPGRIQQIGLATSEDLLTWQRSESNPVITPDPKWYHAGGDDLDQVGLTVDARDLIIQANPSGNGWYGFYAARTREAGLAESAAIAAVFSTDLVKWTHLAPAFDPKSYACIEVPDVFPLAGRWYMTCLARNLYGNRAPFSDPHITDGTIYAVADSIEGPYAELEDDNVLIGGDTTSGYSCRSVEKEGTRYVLYTEPTKSEEDSLSPPLEVIARDDGRLRLRYNPRFELLRAGVLHTGAVTKLDPVDVTPFWPNQSGRWAVHGTGAEGSANGGWQTASLGFGAADVEITASFATSDARLFGFTLFPERAPANADGGFFCGVDRHTGTCIAAEIPDFTITHRRSHLVQGEVTSLRLVVRHPRFELFVNDELVMQFAHPLPLGDDPSLGLLVEKGSVYVDAVSAWRLRRES